ncbi:MAG: trypsin-like peptidase domain-containing protein [Chloroflexota bacterium]|nr:trypsin-like peptidase domain-containing protein [Chloroflexota bacterium]
MTDPHGPEDADLTRRHEFNASPEGAAPDGATDPLRGDATADRWIEPLAPSVERYAPAPEPRTDWSRPGETGPTITPERWYEPAPVGASAVSGSPGRSDEDRGHRGGFGTIFAAALLSAVLASSGTLVALSAVGALDQPTPVQSSATGQTVGSAKPVTIDESSATIDVAAKVSPAVVRITTTGDLDTNLGVIPETGVGSGVIYDGAGWILTNRHVVEGSDTLQVELNDGRILTGTVYGIDTLTDLAIVKVDGTELPTAATGISDDLKVGQLVVAIGSPLGTYSNSVTSGIVSAKGRSITTNNGQNLNNLIQTDAAINPGNSGGPLLDADGNVVGINTAIAADSNGIGFAIPIDIARPIMVQAVAGRDLARPYMGVTYVTITRQIAESEQLPATDGALIGGGSGGGAAVQPGTPAADAGIRDGDIIVKVNGKVIDTDHPLDAVLSQFAPGDTVSVEILRAGQPVTLTLTLGTRPADL